MTDRQRTAPADRRTTPDGARRASRGSGPNPLRSVLSFRPTPARVVAAVLVGLLGFAVAVQVRSNELAGLETLRESDLVRLLEDSSEQSARLRAELAELEETRRTLETGSGTSRAAIEDAEARARTLGILAGTLPAAGPGIVLTVPDPDRTVTAEQLLDAVQELRDAGAEAMQVGDVRVVASTYFTDEAGAVVVDGEPLDPPYRLVAIGDPRTLSSALDIPGGVRDTLRRYSDVEIEVEQSEEVRVTALRSVSTPQYARPAEPEE